MTSAVKPLSLGFIAQQLEGEVRGDSEQMIKAMGTLKNANEQQLSFLANNKYLKDLETTKAGAVILNAEQSAHFSGNSIVVKDPYLAFAKASQLLDSTPVAEKGISDSACIHSGAKLGSNVSVGPGAVVSNGANIGDDVTIGANCFIGENAQLSRGVNLRSNVTIYHEVILEKYVSVHSGTVIGSDGFGYANDKGVWVKIPQTGRVIVGEHTEIGANTCIDRGALDDTVIGKHVIIDNLVQIAHNVVIDDYCCICGSTGIAGSTHIGKYVVIAGQCAINGHLTITDKVQITGQSMVTKSIKESGVYSSGMPVMGNRDWQKNTVQLRQINKWIDKIKHLEKKAK